MVSNPDTDDDVVKLARKFRQEAVATLVSIIRNERSPAAARANAAERLLNLSDPGPRSVNINDIDHLTDYQCEELMLAMAARFHERGWPAHLQYLVEEDPQPEVSRFTEAQQPPFASRYDALKPPAAGDGETETDAPEARMRRRTRVLLDDPDDDEVLDPQPEPAPVSTEPRIPVPAENEILIHLPHALTVPWQGRTHQFLGGYCIAPASMAEHPVVKRFIVSEDQAA